jgi:anhydro-N-acetylmuramic acid kinase
VPSIAFLPFAFFPFPLFRESEVHEVTHTDRKRHRFIAGLMSGTSVDGIDAVLVRVWGSGAATGFEQVAYVECPFPPAVKAMILRNSLVPTARIDDLTRLNMLLPQLYADAVKAVARKGRVPLWKIDLIGCHGQTVHHLPAPVRIAGKTVRATLQLGDVAALATLTGITTVGNFRTADMAVGGQGAPLVPYFDWLMFRSEEHSRLLLNIGGIGNITVLPAGCAAADVFAFDTGPGNMIVDGLMKRLYKRPYDSGGKTAASGRPLPALLGWLLKDPYLRQRPPKSTGRELYTEAFLDEVLARSKRAAREDIIHTAALYTPLSVRDAYVRFVAKRTKVDEVIVSGGGAKNLFFMEALNGLFGEARVSTADEVGMSSDAKEAICFAILANETVHGKPANLPRVTGAKRAVVLGVVSRPQVT